MSVLCCHIPDFLLTLACREQPNAVTRPFALLDPDERVCAVSLPARQSGVRREMPARQAQMRCPDIALRPLDIQASQAEQEAFLSTVSRWQLPAEAHGWGATYVDLNHVAETADQVQPLAADLGRQVRQSLGQSLQPALGWDSGKFTARAAAAYTMPGHMRLVGKTEESRFLSPLTINLLPLPLPSQQQLYWLGIRTLGQFAALPPAAIWQRFGHAGRLAQSWAKGQDRRPVCSTVQPAFAPIEFDLDPPTSLLHPVVESSFAALAPHLQAMCDRMEGCRRLHLDLHFVDGSAKRVSLLFVEATCKRERLQHALLHNLETLEWPAELEHVSIVIIETAELFAQQLSLFPELLEPASPFQTLIQKLAARYGGLLFRGELIQPNHMLAERRIQFQALT